MEDLRKAVINMQFKIKDLMDEPNDSAAGRLNNEVQGLEDDLQVKKNARTIEDRVKRIINLLEGDARRAPIMNIEHLQMLQKWFEDLRDDLRKLQ
jgi:hypothetical protein